MTAPTPTPSPSSKPVALIIGASRGIGRQIAIDLALANYTIIVSSKSTSPSLPTPFPPDPNSSLSTIHTVTHEILLLGGTATAIPVDVTSPSSIQSLITATIATYGRLDALIYNAGAIFWASVQDTSLKRFQLMQRVNPEGLYAAVQAALPWLKQSEEGGRIVVVCPPIYSRFFRGKTAYAMGKVGMSVLVKGLGMDWVREGRVGRGGAVTGVWPAVAIQSAATEAITKKTPEYLAELRHAGVFSRAVLEILKAPAEKVNGELLLDEDFLREHCGLRDEDLAQYALVPGSSPRRIMPRELPDLRVKEQDDEGMRMNSAKEKGEAKL